ncbi:unnamed protein product [Brugia pahangi]|uniref:Transposase n=1 Tax=Brugia pahangi TaxID=6280 RepID=A0A0N4TFT9_BRUPA|nr:unnamed protein product [Brugia pahangi]
MNEKAQLGAKCRNRWAIRRKMSQSLANILTAGIEQRFGHMLFV